MFVVPGTQSFNFSSTASLANGLNKIGTEKISLYTANQPRLTIDANGNVGIGTTLPQEKLHIVGNLRFDGDELAVENLVVNNSLIVRGTTTTIDSTTLSVDDAMIRLADNNAADLTDIGFYGMYVDTGVTKFTGMIHDASTNGWKIFNNETNEPGLTTATITDSNVLMSILDTGNVGIGTNNPTGGKLQVEQNSNAFNTLALFQNSTAGTSSVARFSLQSDNGGLLLDAYSSTFTTSGSAIADSVRIQSNAASSNGLSFEAYAGDMRFYAPVSTERMRILSGGNVGIGTTNPSTILDIEKNQNAGTTVSVTNTTTGTAARSAFHLIAGGSIFGGLYLNNSSYTTNVADQPASLILVSFQSNTNGINIVANGASTAGIKFWTAGTGLNNTTERMRINASGNVGINTTNPTEKFTVEGNTLFGNIAGSNGMMRTTYGGGTLFIQTGTSYSSGSSADLFIGNMLNNTTESTRKVMIKANGDVGIGTTNPAYQLELSTDSAAKPTTNTWTISSDQRLKENIVIADYDQCYTDIKNLDMKYFKWRDEYIEAHNVQDAHKIGWIADEVEAVYPKAITTYDVGVSSAEYVITGVTSGIKSLNTDLIYAGMFGAMKKMISKIEQLEQDKVDMGVTIAYLLGQH